VIEVLQELDRNRNRESMRESESQHWVYRNRTWVQVPTQSLVQGDIISVNGGSTALESDDPNAPGTIGRGHMAPADILLLRGAVSADESILTGESVPVQKESPGMDDNGHSNDEYDQAGLQGSAVGMLESNHGSATVGSLNGSVET